MTAPHRIPLGDTEWSVWREAGLRTPGFPADGLDRFAAPECAEAADAVLAAEADATLADPALFDKAFAAAVDAGDEQIRRITGDPLVREAITWQNADLLRRLDSQTRKRTEVRRRREVVVRYWQRYCAKNETIGFFGPVLPVQMVESGPAVRAHPGPHLVRHRRIFLEWWTLAAYADSLAADPAVRRWLVPALQPHLRQHDREVLRPAQPPVAVSAAEAAALTACDGRRPAVEVVRSLVGDATHGVRTAEDGYLLLERLVERGLLRWDAALPVSPDAEQVLSRRIDAIGDDQARARASAGLRRLLAARDAVAAAAADPEALRVALARLDEEFTALTGQDPRRRDGQMYAGRTLCYEDTRRDLDASFGPPLLAEIAAPLAVLLQASRWLTVALAEAYGRVLRELYDELRTGGGPVRLADLWFWSQGSFWGDQRPVDAVATEFAQRWTRLFGLDQGAPDTTQVRFTAAALAERVAETFPADRPAWSAGRVHSPDLQICAANVDAINRGEYFVVLGELHAAWAAHDCAVFTVGHPAFEALRDGLAADIGPDRIRLLYPLDWPRHSARLVETLLGPTDRQLGFAAAPGADPDRLLPATAVTVEDVDGELVAIAEDGHRWPLLEMFSRVLSIHAVDGFKLVAAAPHTARITVDRLVVARETWRTTVGETGLVEIAGDQERYLEVRRWRRRLGVPDRVFVKVGTETKPCYADLTSPAFALSLCSMLRAAQGRGGDDVPVIVTELLPTPDQAWVPDAAGRRYFSELRLQVTDACSAAGGPP